MKRIKKKAMIGALVSAAVAGINAGIQKNIADKQLEQQNRLLNAQNANNFINNMNQQANIDTSWAYDKFNSIYKCGGTKKIKRAKLGKFKSRY